MDLNAIGSVASILALAITFGGCSLAFIRWGHKRRMEEYAKLAELKETISARARAATTQGKRSDLFIYYDTLLSNQRHTLIVREINAAVIQILFLLVMVLYVLAESSSITGQQSSITASSDFNILMVIASGISFCFILFIRFQLTKEHRRLRHAARGLTDVLEDYITDSSR